MWRCAFSLVEITQSLLTEVFSRAGQKPDLMCTMSSNFAARIVIIFGFFSPCFPIAV